MNRLSWFNTVSLTLGFAFLYIPMIILIIFSFNESKLVTVGRVLDQMVRRVDAERSLS